MTNTKPEAWDVGDIIQIDPAHDERFGACLMVVSEPKPWGAQGYVQIPAEGQAYYRLHFEDGVRVGHAEWQLMSHAIFPTAGDKPQEA